MAEKAVIYAKSDEKTILFTGTDSSKVVITGLAPATVVADGDYLVAINDDATKEESKHVAVPGFTVNAAKPADPEGVTSTPTDDGAEVATGK